ncbi:hypothetical protein MKEN_01439500 [Mycena kentingensis (nom. inval.)]|nr:hypothetical protein MKEN_01439500 [Mycena kentingensis (nom. inval.)]
MLSLLLLASALVATSAPVAPRAASDFQRQNGIDAQALNAKFATLTESSTCSTGEQACVKGAFAQCVGGAFVMQPCSAGTICAALPLVNSPGTSIACDTSADVAARIAASGATGGIDGSGSTSVDSDDGEDASADADDDTADEGEADADEGDDDDDADADDDCDSDSVDTEDAADDADDDDTDADDTDDCDSEEDDAEEDDAETDDATPSPVNAASSSDSSTDFHLQNGLDAQKQNAKFATLTKDSTCDDGEQACIGDSFAQCVGGKFALTACAAGTTCASLPLVNKPGTSIGCDSTDDAAARIAATGATGGLRGSA